MLQRINSFVFADPHLVMHNVGRVTEHIESKVRGWVPELIPSSSGELFYDDPAGGVWRLTRFVEQARARQKVENPHQAAAAGAAFARFQNLLYDLPPPLLTPTIPGFLRLGHYLDEWNEVGLCRRFVTPKQSNMVAQSAQPRHNGLRMLRVVLNQRGFH